jgi:CRP/FNR family transcriptional regulator, cyclic AMP receptor protein
VLETATINIFKNAETSERYAAGDVIFEAGDPGDRFFVVREGTVALSANGRVLEEVGPGGIFGELGLLERVPRSATATAATDCNLVALDERGFIFHVSQTPFFALTVMRVLAERLRRESAAA